MKAEAGKFHPGPEHARNRFDADRARSALRPAL
jgi:hypothetical protein